MVDTRQTESNWYDDPKPTLASATADRLPTPMAERARRAVSTAGQPAIRTAALAALFLIFAVAAATSGDGGATLDRDEIADDRGADPDGEAWPTATTAPNTEPTASTAAASTAAAVPVTTPFTTATTVTSETPTIPADNETSVVGTDVRFVLVGVGECDTPGYATASLLVVTGSCLDSEPLLEGRGAAYPIAGDLFLTARPAKLALTVEGVSSVEPPSISWSSDVVFIGPTADRAGAAEQPGDGSGTGSLTVGWLPCGQPTCDVTAPPELAIPLALARLVDEDPAGDNVAICSDRVAAAVTSILPATDELSLRCESVFGPVTDFDGDGCGTVETPPWERAALQLIEIGVGVDDASFKPLLTVPAAARVCLIGGHDHRSLRFRYRTALSADEPVPELFITGQEAGLTVGPAIDDAPGLDDEPQPTDPSTAPAPLPGQAGAEARR